MAKYVTFDSHCCPDCTPALHLTALVFVSFLPGVCCLCIPSWRWASVACLCAALLPRVLWQPGRGDPAEGSKYTFALGFYWNFVMISCFASPLLLAIGCWYCPLLCLPTFGYVVWARFLSRAELGDGAAWPWFSQQEWGYHAFRRYLQLRIHVHTSLYERPVDKPVVLAIHPHGVASDYRIMLDGMLYEALPHRNVLTLSASVLFHLPLVRELSLWTRCIDARKSVACRALRKGHSLMVIPGGEHEQIRTVQGKEEVYLSKRMGFIKIALQERAAVAPCYVFGCVDLYKTFTGFLKAPREWLRKSFGICIPLYYGALGLLPLRHPVHVVMGAPIEFECKVAGFPSDEEVQQAHAKYVAALTKLYNEERHHYGDPERELLVS
mmetsp:Transcript_59165/g.138447  ORF Transcript_59165/g.138447 Transcript_59165/m.138447 type:complete len:381 (-) Transcript_59165:58-1200(-)